ncbi:MAG: hypothetical protein RB191_24385, partial [Terriglobia bacterium]|nr:hypothetical protein [Terriglobia bacterium]
MQLLSIIAGNDTTGMYEIRCRNPRNGRIGAREWFGLDERKACLRYMGEHAPALDVYVGAALRTGREGGKAAIARVWCLWADLDT